MKQKLFVLGLLLSFVVTGSQAWTGNDDTWWQQYGYTEDQQIALQTYVPTRNFNQGYAVYLTQETSSHVGTGLDLDWTAFDQAKNGIFELLNANRSKLSEVQAIALEKVYSEAVGNERLTMTLWYGAIYNQAQYEMKTARFYTNLQTAWQAKIDDAATQMEKQLELAQYIVQGNVLLQQYQDLADKGDRNFFGKNASAYTQDLVWTDLKDAVDELQSILAGDDVKSLNASTSLNTNVSNAVNALANYLAMNEAYKKDIDDAYDKLLKLYDQAVDVLYAVDDENEYVLQEPYHDQLKKATEKAETAIAAIGADQALRAYDKIEFDDVMNNDIALAYSELRAALSASVTGQNQSNMLLDRTWTYSQPLPIGKVDGAPYALNWTKFNDAQSALADTNTGLTELNNAAKEIAQEYAGRKTTVEEEWTANAFNADQTSYTKPNQWAYNQTAWNNDIALDAEAMEFVSKVAAKVDELNNAYTTYQLADEKVLGAYAAQYGAAKTDVEAILNMDQAAMKDLLLNANAETLANINNVRAKFLAAVNANQEEVDDVKTAGKLLDTAIAQAEDVESKLNGDIAAQATAKTQLQNAIADAKAVKDNVDNEAYDQLQNAETVTEAIKALTTNLISATNAFDAAAPTPATVDPAWAYDTPEYKGEKGNYTLDWHVYDQNLADLNAFIATAASDAKTAGSAAATDYGTKEGTAQAQWNGVAAWTDVADDAKLASNWSYNQLTWQAGIDEDAAQIAKILSMLKQLEVLNQNVKDAKALTTADILSEYATPVANAIADAEAVIADKKMLDKLTTKDSQDVMEAGVNLQSVLAANAEEIEDVKSAAEILRGNIATAEGLKEKGYINESELANLQAKIDDAQAVLDLVDAKNFETIENAKTVTEQYMALTDYMASAMKDSHTNHAPQTMPAGGWIYSEPLAIGTESATAQVLNWAKYDEAMTTVKNYQNTTTDAALNGLLAPIVTAYEGKQEKVKEQFDWVGAWPSSDYKSANNYEYNKDMWDLQILQDANYLSELGVAAQDIQNLYEAIQAATTLTNSTAILGAYKTALDAAIQEGQNAHDAAIASINETNALYTAQQVKMAIANLQAIVSANTEETEDVKAADVLLAKAIEDAKRAKESVEDVDGGTAYQTNIQTAIDAAKAIYDLAEDDKFTDAATPVADAQTITDAIYTLNEAVAAQVLAYAGDITNTTGVDWAYATPLRLGDNQDPAAQDSNGDTKYTLNWTEFDKALDEMTNAAISATEVATLRNNAVSAMTQRKTDATTQWNQVPAWTGTNDKFVNQFQYNQTTWQQGINEDVKTMQNATKVFATLNALDAQIKEAETFIASEAMLQAPYLKNALQDAIDAAKAHYTGMTDGSIDATELNYATTQAISIGLKDALDAVAEETKSVKTVQPLLNSAIADAKVAKTTVENVDGGKAFADNIQAAINAAQTILENAQQNKFLSGDIRFAKTLTDAIRDLNKAVRDNVGEYTSSIDNVAPVLLEWMYAQPLRIGKEKDPVAQDANHETVYTLDWTEFDKALSDLNATYNALQNADLKSKAELIYNSYGAKETQAKSQWTSEPAWTGINDKYVNQYQYNQTAWNNGIANDAKVINNFIDLIVAMDKLNQSMTNAKDTEKVIPAAGNTNVVKPFAAGIDEKYTAAENLFNEYIAKLAGADFYATNYDVQKVNGAQSALDLLVALNKEEKKDIDEYRPLIFESIKVAQDLQKKIEDAAETKYYDALGEAIKTANTVYNNAWTKKYNEFNNAQEVTKARRALVLAMVKQQNAYQDTISALKDTLQQTIDDARAASLVVNTHNTYSTDLQNEIAGAYAMMSGNAMLLPTDNQDLNITKLQTEIARLKRVYCSAFILDLDSLKAAIADAQKFYDGITPFVGYKGVEKAQTDIKTAIETAQAFLTDAEAKNATQTSTSNPYNPTFTTADAFNTYNTVDVPAATDALNKAHMAINLAALKAVADSIKSYVDNEQVVTLYQNSLNQVIDHANSVYGQYQPTANDKAAFSNFETQDKITDAIVTAIGDAQKFYTANDDAIAEAETVRTKLATKIADATTLKGELTDAASQNNLQTAIETATALKDTKSASPEELTNGITALDLAMKTARWTDDIARLKKAIQTKEEQNGELTDEDAKEIMTLYITKAQALLAKLQASVYTTVTTAEVSAMISELDKGLTQAQTYNNGEMLPDLLAKAKPYKDLIPTEYQAALDAQENSASLAYAAVKAAGDALAEATAKAEAYTLAKNQLQTAIDEAKLAEEQSADYKQAIEDAETAVAAAFTQNQTDLTNITNNMEAAYNTLKTQMNGDRWSHQALGGKMIVKPWKPNDPNPGQAQYIKLAGKYTSADAGVANNSVDLFITDIQGTAGTRTFDWAPFSAESDYAANIVNLTSVGVSDFNNFKKYGWSYDEHYNDIIIKAGAIYSSGDGFVNANHAYGPFTWTNVWNQNDLDILDKDADGNYYGRYYTYKWSETNEGGVYRVPAVLGIYDDTEDQFKVNGIKTYISKPNEDGSYYINSDLILDGDKGYDTEATVFNYENGTAILNGRWHRVQFIDRNQFLFHQAAQKAADWYNNNPDLRHYDTAALIELKKAVESNNNKWDIDAIEAAMEKVLNSYDKVDMIKGDNLYGVIADGDYADVQRTYTVTGAPGDKIDAEIIAQTENWTKDDSQYWEIISNGNIIGADSTATITVKFTPGTTYPADYREYQAILDVKVGNLNYQDDGKENLQQNLYGSNPKLSLKENELLQAHSLNLHRKDSITYDLYGRGYAHLYEKSPLTAKFYSATGLLLAESEVKTTLVKNQFTAYAADNDLDQTKFTVSYYPEDLGVDVVKVVISDTIRQADDIVLTVNAAKSQITFDPATVTDANQNSIKLDKMADGTDSYFFPADGETYFFPIAISNFDGVNANTKVVNKDGVISITTEVTDPTTGLVVEHERHDVQITIDNRDYFTVETATTEINGTSKNIFVISVKTDKLEQGTLDDGQHDGLLQIIWQDQDTINIHLNQTLPWFSAPTTAAPGAGPIVDSVDGNIEWEFTEDGDKIWYVDVNDVDNYYNYAVNFGAYTNTDWFIVDPAISYQLTPQRGTRKYRLKITYNPHEVNTVYTDVLTLNIFDTKRNVIVATTSINLKGDAVSSIKGGATGVNNAEVENSKKDGKYFKNGKIVIVKGDQEFNASGAQTK
ncbi:MAG: hypothetical protein IKP84_00275 [Prevotella sp.]|nr:hypothetical protein [Prevotella sp.]MBR6086320.1 hypothetical protein [Prevotella sp.]